MQKNIKKIFVSSLISLLFVQMIYVSIEPTIATAATAIDTAIITLNVDAGISISNGADATMSAMSAGVNTSIGTSAWTVITNSYTGYHLDVKASTNPALKNGVISSFADYTEGTAGVPETWSVPSGNKEFGFSGYGNDVLDATYGALNTCGSGSTIPAQLYQGFATTDQVLANATVATPYSGVVTNICFAVEQDGVFAPSGTYTATITGTATTQ